VLYDDLCSQLITAEDLGHTELNVLSEVFQNKYKLRRDANTGILLESETRVLLTDITKKRYSSLYIIEADINITVTDDIKNAKPHPYNEKEILKRKVTENNDSFLGINFHVELVDNETLIGNRFLIFNRTPYTVSPIRDESRRSGAYLSVYDKITKEITTEFYRLAEIEEGLGLYKTIEEAATNGDVKSALAEKIADLNHQIALESTKVKSLEVESNSVKHRNAMELLEKQKALAEKELENKLLKQELENERAARESVIESEKAKLDAEKIRMDKEALRMKEEYDSRKYQREDYYESRSHSRKDTSEVMKMVPTVLSLIAVGFALYKS
jgi:hypothetical protein